MPERSYAYEAHRWVHDHWQEIMNGVPDQDIKWDSIQAVERGASHTTIRNNAVYQLTELAVNQGKWNIKEAAEQLMREIKAFEFITLAEIEKYIRDAIYQQFYMSVRSWRLEVYAP